VDKNPEPGMFIITGSQQFNLMEKVTESLAGRAAFLTLLPFSVAELVSAAEPEGTGLCTEDPYQLMLKGLYPPLYDREISAWDFYTAYISSYVERDIRQLINVKDLSTFQNFVKFCAARTGGILNLSSLAGDCGISHNTAGAWISALEISGIIFLLRPYYNNFGKRLIKAPKLYFTDPGLVCRLLGIQTAEQLFINPLRGGIFESFIIAELMKNRLNRGQKSDIWFWRDNTGVEIDCLLEEDNRLVAVEIKSGKTFNEDMISGLKHWQKISSASAAARATAPAMKHDLALIYAGAQKSSYQGIKLFPWKDVVHL